MKHLLSPGSPSHRYTHTDIIFLDSYACVRVCVCVFSYTMQRRTQEDINTHKEINLFIYKVVCVCESVCVFVCVCERKRKNIPPPSHLNSPGYVLHCILH